MHERNVTDNIGASTLQKGPVGCGVLDEAKDVAILSFEDVGKVVFAEGNHAATVLGDLPHLICDGADLDLRTAGVSEGEGNWKDRKVEGGKLAHSPGAPNCAQLLRSLQQTCKLWHIAVDKGFMYTCMAHYS